MNLRHVETFYAVDERGKRTRLSIYQRMIPVRGHGCSMPGLKEVFSEHGGHVNRIDDQTYQVVATGEILTRI